MAFYQNGGGEVTRPKSFFLSPEIHEYLVAHGSPPDEVLRWLTDETRKRFGDAASMQVAPEQGAFLTILTRVLGARFAVEVGTFAGYSALCIARGLGPDGRLLACDVSEKWTALGREAWRRAGVDDRIDLRIAPAIQTLRDLPGDHAVDLAFIDADKRPYLDYYEELVPRLSSRGVILVDNVLWHGHVVNPDMEDERGIAICRFNDHVVADERVDAVMLPISDGLTMISRRGALDNSFPSAATPPPPDAGSP
jgi:caffeoyl-CoA O-methyltransferase